MTLVPPDWEDKMPKPLWNRVVCISFVEARIARDAATGLETYQVERVASGGEADWDEQRLLAGFWRFFAENRFRVVTWNGRSFDIPVLLSRAFLHGIPTGAWHRRGGRWDGYTRRYSDEFHADIMDFLSGHGATTRMKLDETATAIGLPGKMGEHGSNVAGLIQRGDVEHVRSYCELDCLNTMGCWARFALLSGRCNHAGYDATVASMVEYLERERLLRPHLGAFLDAWQRPALAGNAAQAGPAHTDGTPDRRAGL
jgi:predicted PolB exonuclease-like 3'-5' exonuclease